MRVGLRQSGTVSEPSGGSLSPRFDHRPPVIAFVILLVLAVAVLGTSARAVDGVVAGSPIEARIDTSGTARLSLPQSSERVRVASRHRLRPGVDAIRAEHAAIRGTRGDRQSVTTEAARGLPSSFAVTSATVSSATVSSALKGQKRGWGRHHARALSRLATHAGHEAGRTR